MSLPGKLYEKFDNGMIYLANNAVHAWNWTTGKGKASLANKLGFLGLGVNLGGMAARSLVPTAIISAMAIPVTLFFRDTNDKIEYLEERATNSGCLSSESERLKGNYSVMGPLDLVCAGGMFATEITAPNRNYIDRLAAYTAASGLAVFASQFYIMRADYVPPRKNCISRGIDWAKKKWAEISQPEPVPTPSLVGNMDYFDYFARQGYGSGK